MLKTNHSAEVGILSIAVLLTVAVSRAESQTAVTACGQIVTGDAYLAGDLDCAEDVEFAVQLIGGSLDLRGFSIRGAEYGVLCAETLSEDPELYRYLSCRVFGGGTVAGQSVFGIDGRQLVLDDVSVGSDGALAVIAHKRLRFTNLSIQLGATGLGIYGTGRARVEGSDLTVTGGTSSVESVKMVDIDGVTASGYSYRGVSGKTVKLSNASLTGGTYGVVAANAQIESSVVTGHSSAGIVSRRIKITNSTVTGNTPDLEAERRPRLKDSTCETSNGWGVCSGD